MVLLFKFIDKMYLVGASEAGAQGVVYPVDFAEEAFDFGKFATAALILTWCSIASVKFSYLFIFRKLIDRVRPMLVYWWVAVVYNVLICMYGASVYVASCPYYYSFKACKLLEDLYCHNTCGHQKLRIIVSGMHSRSRSKESARSRHQSDDTGHHR